jgi:16S rRNA (cytidine1402-2'-O)-methyltransferase
MLYLVATPIGNLGDITLRAIETLKSVDIIASEDSRRTRVLLQHLDIKKPQIQFHEHNEHRMVDRIIGLIKEGKSVALVSDAGTPGISDPGFTLVRAAAAASVSVTMVPGPAAFVMALVLSGLPVHSFTFRGFPPRKTQARRRFLSVDLESPHTLIYYESPYRIRDLLFDASEVFGDRNAALANDLTKMYERVDRATLSKLVELVGASEPRGEYVLVVEGLKREPAAGRSRSRPAR